MADFTILIVEDHDILREGLQILLESEGYRVITAPQGKDALRQMNIAAPDLILSDISMPEMDGYEFYDRVRARPEWMAIPFIFLTARGDRADVLTSKKLGVEDYLIKPVDRLELVSSIRSRLERSQQLMLAQLQQAYEASLIMLANAIELRDSYTRGHVERVRDLSVMIAEQLGMGGNQIKVLKFGAILHDIGKIYVREGVLRKPGSLDDAEWTEMKRHAEIGAELLARIPYLTTAIPIIQHHHERWDGKGYPAGLSGESIPLEARIVAVADSFDAMTTARVYQAASTAEQAVKEIVAGIGSRYDPKVVDAFLTIKDKLIQPVSDMP
jgi:putative two-component system response regulator